MSYIDQDEFGNAGTKFRNRNKRMRRLQDSNRTNRTNQFVDGNRTAKPKNAVILDQDDEVIDIKRVRRIRDVT